MSKLYMLLYGKSKSKMHPIMIDTLKKCENYRDARGDRLNGGWHNIIPADANAKVWRQKSTTIGGNKCITVPRVGKGQPGYIGKNGFNPHT